MDINELGALLKDIAEKTGLEVFLQPEEGTVCIPLDLGGKTVNAYFRGEGEEAERIGKLIAYLVAGAGAGSGLGREDDLKGILLGEGGRVRVFRFMTKYNLSDGACYALDVLPDKHSEACFQHIERCFGDERDTVVKMDDTRLAVVKFLDEEQSPYDFGQFLSQSLYEELGVRASIGVGCEMKSFGEISTSYNQATTAVRMSGMFRGEGEVHSYREFLLVRMLEDVDRSRLKEYIEQFRIDGAAEVFDDEDMTATAEAFLESSLNISETSRNLFMHRNTLTYRLDKIERATGLNIRKFSDAVTFRVITILYKLLKS